MTSIHPDWQEENETPVEVRVKETQQPTPKEPTGVTVSRRPAAMVGMLIVIAIGVGFFQGMDGLLGQVAPSGPVISITEDGVTPSRLEVEHGQTITFVNNQDVAHRIESSTLCSDTGYCLQTKSLNRGDSDTFTITPDMQSGPYEFMSTTSGDVRGVIIIVTQTVDDFVDITSILGDNFIGEDVNTTTPFPEDFSNAVAANVFNQDPSSGNIPQNPYTVDSERIHPFDSSGNPVAEAFGDEPAQVAFTQTQGPLRQPETGPGGVVSLVFLSIAALWWFTKESFAQTSL